MQWRRPTRVVVHVAAAQVEQPRDLVQAGGQQRARLGRCAAICGQAVGRTSQAAGMGGHAHGLWIHAPHWAPHTPLQLDNPCHTKSLRVLQHAIPAPALALGLCPSAYPSSSAGSPPACRPRPAPPTRAGAPSWGRWAAAAAPPPRRRPPGCRPPAGAPAPSRAPGRVWAVQRGSGQRPPATKDSCADLQAHHLTCGSGSTKNSGQSTP